MRTAAGALAWMREQDESNARGWLGYCLKACRTAWGLSGGWDDADAWWADVPPEHRHPWSEAPPAAAPIYWRVGAHGHVALSNGDGTIYGTDLPTSDQIGRTSIHAPRDRWGAVEVGWASWLNGAELPLGSSGGGGGAPTPDDGVAMDYAEVTRRNAQRVGTDWAWLTLDNDVRNTAGVHYKDGIWSMSSRRFDLACSLSLTTPSGGPARVSVQACVVDNAGNVTTAYPVQSFDVGNGSVSGRHAYLSGYCSADRRVRIRVRSLDAATDVVPYVVARRFS